MADVHAQRAERLDEMRHLLRRTRVDGAAREFRNRRGDVKPELVRHLVRISNPPVDGVEQEGQANRPTESPSHGDSTIRAT